jgi:hypothetical protein
MSRQQKTGRSYDRNVAYKCLRNVAEFKYLGTVVTNQNYINAEIERRLNSIILYTIQFRISYHPVL